MIIPTSFELAGFKWKVVLRKRLKGRYGDCDLKKRQIQILETLDDDLKEQTFLHELCHCVYFAMGVNQEDHNEQHIDAFAMYLHQFMKSAKYG